MQEEAFHKSIKWYLPVEEGKVYETRTRNVLVSKYQQFHKRFLGKFSDSGGTGGTLELDASSLAPEPDDQYLHLIYLSSCVIKLKAPLPGDGGDGLFNEEGLINVRFEYPKDTKMLRINATSVSDLTNLPMAEEHPYPLRLLLEYFGSAKPVLFVDYPAEVAQLIPKMDKYKYIIQVFGWHIYCYKTDKPAAEPIAGVIKVQS